MKSQKLSFFANSRGKKFAFTIWGMLEKLARTHLKLGPKIRAKARTRSSLGFQYSYSLGAWDFDARPIPMSNQGSHCKSEHFKNPLLSITPSIYMFNALLKKCRLSLAWFEKNLTQLEEFFLQIIFSWLKANFF